MDGAFKAVIQITDIYFVFIVCRVGIYKNNKNAQVKWNVFKN